MKVITQESHPMVWGYFKSMQILYGGTNSNREPAIIATTFRIFSMGWVEGKKEEGNFNKDTNGLAEIRDIGAAERDWTPGPEMHWWNYDVS